MSYLTFVTLRFATS